MVPIERPQTQEQFRAAMRKAVAKANRMLPSEQYLASKRAKQEALPVWQGSPAGAKLRRNFNLLSPELTRMGHGGRLQTLKTLTNLGVPAAAKKIKAMLGWMCQRECLPATPRQTRPARGSCRPRRRAVSNAPS